MNRPTSVILARCPDCGGILEPVRPAWLNTIDVAAATGARDEGQRVWRCMLCGYHTRETDTDAPGRASA